MIALKIIQPIVIEKLTRLSMRTTERTLMCVTKMFEKNPRARKHRTIIRYQDGVSLFFFME
jgi:hypothetical protein